MKRMFLFGALCAILCLSSCSISKEMKSSAKAIEPKIGVYVADLDIKTVKVKSEFVFEKSLQITENEMIDNAIFNALDKINADFMVGIQTQVSSVLAHNGELKSKKVIVTGYPAYYKNIRPVPANYFTAEELKADTPYIIKENVDGEEISYVIISPEKDNGPVLKVDTDELSVDHMTFKNKKSNSSKK
jgi:hypothetical protein